MATPPTTPSATRRQFLQRSGLVIGAAAFGSGILTACSKTNTAGGSGRLADLKKKGTITVGIAGEQPYAFLDNGKLTGMDPTVQSAVWKALGIPNVNAKQVSFDALIPGLNAGNFDTISAGMFITPTRCAQAAFSDPIYTAPDAFMVAAGNKHQLSNFASAAKAKIRLGVFGGAVEGGYAKSAGVPDGNIVTVPDLQTGITQLKQGRIDAIALTSITLKWALKQHPDPGLQVTTPFVPVVDGKKQIGAGGAVFRKQDKELVDAFNGQLEKLRKSGELLKLIEPFGFGPETVPPPDLTTAKLCAG